MLRLFVAALLSTAAVAKRPRVRNVKTDKEFRALLKHHKDVTGLPVIVDFFSESCGPCRQIAPHFKRLAKQYYGKAVFAKVDVNVNHQTSQSQNVRSMPTFQFYLNGKKRHQFAGGDLRSLESWTQRLSGEAEKQNVCVTLEALKTYYAEVDPQGSRTDAQLNKVIAKAGGPAGGKGHYKLVKALKKKYGKAPETKQADRKEAAKAAKAKKAAKRTARTVKDVVSKLHLATIDQLLEAVEKKKEEQAFDQEDGDDADDEETVALWPGPGEYPERVAIIGGGPAGLAAALYAARAGLRPVVLAPPMGGQLQGKGVTVENYPGVLGGTGPSIVAMMQNQAQLAGTLFEQQAVTSVDFSTGSPFTIFTNTSSFKAHTVIIATGADSRWLGVEGEHEYRGGGVSSCATCDGFLFRDQRVVVIGGGDTAMEDALVLARTSKSVLLIHRRDAFRASKVLADRVLAHDKITVRWNSVVTSFSGKELATPAGSEGMEPQNALTHVNIKSVSTGGTEAYACAAAFVAIGHIPNTKLFASEGVTMDSNGYIVPVSGGMTRTAVEGVFAAGDVADHVYRQAVTSAGTGAMAALDAERWLSERGIKENSPGVNNAGASSSSSGGDGKVDRDEL